MYLSTRQAVMAAILFAAPALMHAQFDFKVDGRDVQIHSFASQGFMSSNDNNYMSMPTSKGSFAFTDGGVSISTQINDNFRVGAQAYDRNIGAFGNWTPQLDWALGDYRFKSWFGIRGGRVKTTLGLFNDIQDNDSLHVFALLPQAIYPIDWRSTNISHDGGDVYGSIGVKHMGTFSYTGYAGMRPQDPTNGYIYASHATIDYTYLGGLQVGGDVRWTTPFGALFGVSYRDQDITGNGTTTRYGPVSAYKQTTNTDELSQAYGQYEIKGLQIDVEYRKNIRSSNLYYTATPLVVANFARAWYVAATYKVNKRLELGAYRSVFLVNARVSSDPPAQHEYDTTISGKVTLTSHWYVKVEGHFINGAPTSPSAALGFYTVDNPAGLQPTTNVLVLRTGVSF